MRVEAGKCKVLNTLFMHCLKLPSDKTIQTYRAQSQLRAKLSIALPPPGLFWFFYSYLPNLSSFSKAFLPIFTEILTSICCILYYGYTYQSLSTHHDPLSGIVIVIASLSGNIGCTEHCAHGHALKFFILSYYVCQCIIIVVITLRNTFQNAKG